MRIPSLRLNGGPIAAITIAGGRSGFELVAVLCERHESGVRPIAAVTRLPPKNRDSIAW